MKNIEINVISDVMCPWCIIGYQRLVKALDVISDHVTAQLHFKPFIMNSHLQEGGQNLWENTSEKYGMSMEESYASRTTFIHIGKEVGFTFNFPKDTRMYNTHKAHQLLMWSETLGKKNELKLAMFRSHFTENLVMDDDSVLAEIAQSVGLDKAQAFDVLYSKRFSAKVMDEEQYWRNSGVNSVPTLVVNQKHCIRGAEEPEVLSDALLKIASE